MDAGRADIWCQGRLGVIPTLIVGCPGLPGAARRRAPPLEQRRRHVLIATHVRLRRFETMQLALWFNALLPVDFIRILMRQNNSLGILRPLPLPARALNQALEPGVCMLIQ